MGKQPYIPLYIGDWEQDTNCLTPLAEFALLKLVFKLFKSEKKGVFITNLRTLSVLFKSNFAETELIFQELIDNNILNITPLNDGKYEIISRRMVREGTISEIRAESGGKGGVAKRKQNISKTEAKHKQNAEYEYEYNSILAYLNNKVSSDFKIKTKSTRQVISARIKEGYVKEDFEKVIDIKTEQWINDKDMAKFLRPLTLFGNKFESYLEESKRNLILPTLKPVH